MYLIMRTSRHHRGPLVTAPATGLPPHWLRGRDTDRLVYVIVYGQLWPLLVLLLGKTIAIALLARYNCRGGGGVGPVNSSSSSSNKCYHFKKK